MGLGTKKNRLTNGEAGNNHRKHRKKTMCQEDSAGDMNPDESRKRQNGMTLEDMYNKEYEFDEDDDDGDWEPSENKTEALKWFCVNCTMLNFDVIHCDVCGEHRESGILNHGFFASLFLPGANIDLNGSEVNAKPIESCLENPSLIKSTLVGYDERMLLHTEVEMKSQLHPERPDRLQAIAASLSTAD